MKSGASDTFRFITAVIASQAFQTAERVFDLETLYTSQAKNFSIGFKTGLVLFKIRLIIHHFQLNITLAEKLRPGWVYRGKSLCPSVYPRTSSHFQ